MKTYYQQINDIKQDVGRIANALSKSVAEQAERDMVKTFDMIIDNFYGSHSPSSYHRKYGLYSALQSHSTKHSSHTNTNVATIIVSPMDMDGHYRTDKENVFDLMWNKGVRGLPKRGNNPLEHDFIQNNQYPFKAGDYWTNPYWSGENDPYHNIFRTSIKLGDYQSIYQVPNNVMIDIVNHWAEANGISACERIAKNLK